MNRDQLFTGNQPELIRKAAYRVITRTQDTPELQLMGVAVALSALCEATGTDPRQLLEAADRLALDVDSPFASQMRALRDYAQNEIGRRSF